MITSFLILLLCQLLGEVLTRSLALPIPGPVIGIALLFALFALQHRSRLVPDAIHNGGVTRICHMLLQNLSLLFVPAGVGVVQRLDLIQHYGVGLAFAIVGSTVITLVVTAVAFTLTAHLVGSTPDTNEGTR